MKVLFITQDYHEKIGTGGSLAINSIISYIEKNVVCEVMQISLPKSETNFENFLYINSIKDTLQNFDYVFLGSYLWSRELNEFVIKNIKSKFVMGGYDISDKNIEEWVVKYPEVSHFVIGHGEVPAVNIISGKCTDKIQHGKADGKMLNNDRHISRCNNFDKISIETRRGCMFNCGFCRYSSGQAEIIVMDFNTVKNNLKKVVEKGYKKINIIDAVFNAPDNDYKSLYYLKELGYKGKVSFQIRHEFFRKPGEIERIIDACKGLNVTFEIGVQTLIEKESNAINRAIHLDNLEMVMRKCKENNIDTEFSIIYGLPFQTPETFKFTVDKCIEMAPTRIFAFRLNLLPGAPLYVERDKHEFVTEMLLSVERVVSSKYCTKEDIIKMETLANSLLRKNFDVA